jgi:uncharacterized protein
MGRCSWKTHDILNSVEYADSFYARLKGLLGRSQLPVNAGLLISPCNSVHTLGMRFPIGVIFLDGEYTICRLLPALSPGRLSPWVPRAKHVLEVNPKLFEHYALAVGDMLVFHA